MTRILLAVLAMLAVPRTAAAHDTRGEALFLDVGEHSVGVEIQVPRQQLDLARRTDHGDLPAYIAKYVGATTRDGVPFAPVVRGTHVERVGDGDVVFIQLELVAPDGASPRWFTLHDDLVLQRVQTDTVYVFLRNDDGRRPQLAGYLHWQQRTLDLALPAQPGGGHLLLLALGLPGLLLACYMLWPLCQPRSR